MFSQLSPADQRKIDRASNRVLAKWNAARKRLDSISLFERHLGVMERNTQALNRNTAELERLSREGGDHD